MAYEIVFSIDETGVVEGLHRDEFPLDFLGRQKIERASDIRFNEATQLWDIWIPITKGMDLCLDAAAGFKRYDEARDFEVRWLNACRAANVDPVLEEAEEICKRLRAWITEQLTLFEQDA
jgi:hypothetical protein